MCKPTVVDNLAVGYVELIFIFQVIQMYVAETTFKGRTENQNKTLFYCSDWCILEKEEESARCLLLLRKLEFRIVLAI